MGCSMQKAALSISEQRRFRQDYAMLSIARTFSMQQSGSKETSESWRANGLGPVNG